ncbi:MAG: galactokinase [Clostridia bacterium]|nr:galactokinase [Clostridia bacterium]
MKEKIKSKFEELFGKEGDIKTYFAPGRVNLIGEHTDYNGGHVFPCALTIGTYAVARKRNDNKLRFYSINFERLGVLESTIEELEYKKEEDWINYPKGMIWALKSEGYKIDTGFDIVYYGTIPNGAGLSSSASIEVLTGFVLKDLFNLDLDMVKLALLGQKAENQYVGVNCGIMDQFIIANGKKDCAVFLDTASLEFEYAPVVLSDAKIVIMNTNKKRGLGDSKYNERRAECEKALEELQEKLDIKTLGELTEEEFEANKDLIKDENRQKRAKHAVYENQRTIKAVKALQENKIDLLGELMIASHNSLRDDYEVTGIELDTLVAESLKQEGVIGARMTGAGFGGCAVSIVKTDKVHEFIQNVGKAYKEKIGYDADFYTVEIGEGPTVL